MTTVLLIDPDIAGTAPIRQALEEQGITVLAAAESHAGFELARQHKPECILLCVELSGSSGYALCNKLKRDPELSRLPLVLASSHATPATFEEHARLRTHADGYLHKPYAVGNVFSILAPLLPPGALNVPSGTQLEPQADLGEREPHVEGPLKTAEPAFVAADEGGVSEGLHLEDVMGEPALDTPVLPLSLDPGVKSSAHDHVNLSPEAHSLLEENIDMQTSTQVYRLSPDSLSPVEPSRAATIDLIGDALAEFDQERSTVDAPASDKDAHAPDSGLAAAIFGTEETSDSEPIETTAAANPAEEHEPLPFTAQMVAPWDEATGPDPQDSLEAPSARDPHAQTYEALREEVAQAKKALTQLETHLCEQRLQFATVLQRLDALERQQHMARDAATHARQLTQKAAEAWDRLAEST